MFNTSSFEIFGQDPETKKPIPLTSYVYQNLYLKKQKQRKKEK